MVFFNTNAILYTYDGFLRGSIDVTSIKADMGKLYRKPVPNDITFRQIRRIATHFGCKIEGGGKHIRIDFPSNKTLPIPIHGKCVPKYIIAEFKILLDEIQETNGA